MNSYIVLSEKPWNADLSIRLKQKHPDKNFVLINNKKTFTLNNIERINPEKIFIPHWSYIIPKEIFENYECIVFHMTDLPFGRGGSPLQNLVSLELSETKISALRVVEELDAGPIYLKKSLRLLGTAEEIFIRANSVIMEMIGEILMKGLLPVKQSGKTTVFKRRTPSMSKIDEIETLERLYDQIRMMDAEGYPKAYLETESFKLEFTRASLKSDKSIIADVRITKK